MDTTRHFTGDVTDATNDAAVPVPADGRFGPRLAASTPRYDAAVVAYDDEPDECTIYPTDASDDELVTTWISAKEGSYVSLEEAR
jgi:hypothetical protein